MSDEKELRIFMAGRGGASQTGVCGMAAETTLPEAHRTGQRYSWDNGAVCVQELSILISKSKQKHSPRAQTLSVFLSL